MNISPFPHGRLGSRPPYPPKYFTSFTHFLKYYWRYCSDVFKGYLCYKFCQVNASIKKLKSWKIYHFIMCDSEIMTIWSMIPLDWIPNHWNFCHFETAFIQPPLIGDYLKFELVIHFYKIFPKTMYLAKNLIRHFCGGKLKLSKLLLCFSFHFQRAISWQGKIQMC